jgi:hypothetical protein
MVKYESPIIELKHLNLRPYTGSNPANQARHPTAGQRDDQLKTGSRPDIFSPVGQADKTETTERVSKIALMHARLSEAAASWQDQTRFHA